MKELKNPHKLMIISGLFHSIKESIVPLLIVFASLWSKILKKHGGKYILLSAATAILVLMIIFAIIKWRKNVYAVDEEGIFVKHGIFDIHERTISFSQVQTADISSSVIQRMFNAYRLQIDTAGGGHDKSEVSLLLSKEEAVKIKNIIFKSKVIINDDIENNIDEANAGREAVAETQFQTIHHVENNSTKKFTSSLKDLFIMATMSSRILAGFTIILALYSKIDDIIPKSIKKKTEMYGENLVNTVKKPHMIKYVIAGIIVMLFISWIISVVVTIIKFYDFTVIREDDNIRLSYGLLDKKEVTIPVNRIQSLIIIEGVLKKPLGYFSLNVETIGYGKDSGENSMLCPIAKKEKLNEFFINILPEMDITYELKTSPKRALRGFMLVRLLDDAIILGLVAAFCPYGYYALILIPLILIWHYIRFKDNGLYFNKDFVVMRFRKLARKTVIIHKECVQSCEKVQTIFQKRNHTAKSKIKIAGDSDGKSYAVGYLNEEDIFMF